MSLSIIRRLTYFIFLLATSTFAFIVSCQPRNATEWVFDYGTKNDSARFYYLKGFHEILDNGRWTASEKSFRKALEFDPNYTLGKSLVGRITRDVKERQKILQELRSAKEKLKNDEQLLLEVYLLSIESYNNRDIGISETAEFKAKRKRLAESNFRKFLMKYPNDKYVKAEYIEWLHLIHGPKVALDSLHHLATKEQMNLGFYISYRASLELELGNLKEAATLAKDLKKLIKDSTYTSALKLEAEIYMAQDSLKLAKNRIEKILRIDPNHMIAHGMLSEIEKKSKNR